MVSNGASTCMKKVPKVGGYNLYYETCLIFGKAQKKVSGVWSLPASPQTRVSAFLVFLLFGYETMSNCSQNCCIDWNFAVLCFKQLFSHRRMNVWPGRQDFVKKYNNIIL